MSYPYVIFVGSTADNMQPFDTAENERAAIDRAIQLKDAFPFTEAVFMPEDDVDTNIIVYPKTKTEESYV